MHLIELIAELEAVKVARGNIRLVDVIVMAAGDPKAIADFADRAAARANPPQLAIDVTGMSDDQVEEIQAENPAAKLVRRAPEPNNAPGEPCHVPGCVAGDVGHEGACEFMSEPEKVPCNHVHVTKGACLLEIDHPGDHSWKNPDAAEPPALEAPPAKVVHIDAPFGLAPATVVERKTEQVRMADISSAELVAASDVGTVTLDQLQMDKQGQLTVKPDALAKVMEDAAAKLPAGETDGDTVETRPVDDRCEQWDGKGHQCILHAGHEVDHDYIEGADAIVEKPTASEPGDAGLPTEVHQPESLQE